MPLYSHSQLETYENCPQKYKFKYIDKLRKPSETGIEAFVGTLVHETFQKLYDDLKLKKLNTLEELLNFYHDRWRQEWGPDVKIIREGLSAQNYEDYGESCIRNYYEAYAPFDQSDTLETEMRLVFALDAEGQHRVQGYVDRVARRPDGVYEIHDYKTSRGLPAQSVVDSSRQLALYQIGLRDRWKDVERVDLIWHYVSSKTTLRSQRTDKELRELAQRTISLIDEIESAAEFEPRKSALCEWCEYRPDCPIWKHLVTVESLPAEEFSKDQGVILANEYAAAKRQRDELDDRLQGLRERIEGFSEQQNVQVIRGNGVQVSVTRSQQMVFPSREDPEWTMLQNIVRNNGKWDEVSEVSTAKLGHALREKTWPKSLLTEIGKYVHTQTRTMLRVASTGGRDDDGEEEM